MTALSLVFLLGSASLLLLSVQTSLADKDPFGCKPRCWETCLTNPPKQYTFIYLYYFHRLISAARDLRLGNPDSKGTIFLLDSTATPGDKFAYQQTLAAIVALTMPVEFNEKDPSWSCNPFFASQHFEFAAWSFPHWQCQDHCDAALFLLGLPFFQEGALVGGTSNPHPDALGGGCDFGYNSANHPNADAIPCAPKNYSTSELVIAFTNSQDQGQSIPGSLDDCTNKFPDSSKKLNVRIVPASTVPGFSNFVYMHKETFLPAANNLLECILKTCCHRSLADARAVDLGRVQVRYMDPSAKGEGGNAARRSGVEVSHIEGTVEEIAKKFFGGKMPEVALKSES